MRATVEVAAADAGGEHPDQRLVGTRLWDGERLQVELAIQQNNRLHGCSKGRLGGLGHVSHHLPQPVLARYCEHDCVSIVSTKAWRQLAFRRHVLDT
ncbi:hypothetical protein GCM10011610_68700 [Nocardia rhizosphaerihabitans]|uniref:Uncharacterized protein n=1 Tax=Nocardia rhizosphaerihabitans TaxID=1691570 RepID=A0ABQ2L249_9NOCA|nr:hypothetical protein GCM10011610_68700 [Nocardia rhizosphaerihabitans]